MTDEEKTDLLVDQALALYKEKLKPLLEPGENGKAVAIEIPTGDYAIGRSHYEARRLMDERRTPGGYIVSMTIGPPTPEDIEMAGRFLAGTEIR